jgi:hypothetical protein
VVVVHVEGEKICGEVGLVEEIEVGHAAQELELVLGVELDGGRVVVDDVQVELCMYRSDKAMRGRGSTTSMSSYRAAFGVAGRDVFAFAEERRGQSVHSIGGSHSKR